MSNVIRGGFALPHTYNGSGYQLVPLRVRVNTIGAHKSHHVPIIVFKRRGYVISINEPLSTEYLFSLFSTTPLVRESPSAAIFTFSICFPFCFGCKNMIG